MSFLSIKKYKIDGWDVKYIKKLIKWFNNKKSMEKFKITYNFIISRGSDYK